jgi:hypothetical protein
VLIPIRRAKLPTLWSSGPQTPIPDEDRIGLDCYGGIVARELPCYGPVSCHPPTIENPRLRQDQCAAAYGAAGVEMDVLGLSYNEFSATQRESIVRAHPRTMHFKEDIIQAFYDGIAHKPETTFGNVKADVLADKDPHFRRGNFCNVIRGSAWSG